jgi:membrane protease YdiL (CAAX protease family)
MSFFKSKPVIFYITITFGLSWALDLFIWINRYQPLLVSLIMPLVMLIPGISAIFIQKVYLKRPLKDLGFVRGSILMYLVAYILPALFVILSCIISYCIGFAGIDNELVSIRSQLSVGSSFNANNMKLQILVSSLTYAVLINSIFTLGEEIGWRGYLYENIKQLGYTLKKSRIITNIIWGLWHAPLILTGLNYPEHPFVGVFWMIIFCILFGWILCWMKDKGRSIFAVALAHAVLNAQGRGLFLTLFPSKNSLLSGPTGFVGFVLMIIIIILIKAIKRKPLQNI